MKRDIHPTAALPLLPVRDTSEVDHLIKEQEIVTGDAGRVFVLLGCNDQSFHIELRPGGYLVDPLNDRGHRTGGIYMGGADWSDGAIVRALRTGLVFTVDHGR